jgi:NhaP-type Na+/H+ or K+/H+ antiporter
VLLPGIYVRGIRALSSKRTSILAGAEGILVLVVMVVMMMVVTWPSTVPNRMPAIATSTYVLQTFKAFIFLLVFMQLKVQVFAIFPAWNVNE